MASEVVEIAQVRQMLRSGRAKALRELAGVSRGEIGRGIGVDSSTVARWETGRRVPRAAAALRYAHLLTELGEGLRA